MVYESNLHLGKGIVRGNQFPIRRIFTRVPSGVTLNRAILTVKEEYADADPGLYQKDINSVDNPGVGEIEDTGANGTARVRFDLTTSNTLSMVANTDYFFDMQLHFSSGDILTIEKGITQAQEEVTQL